MISCMKLHVTILLAYASKQLRFPAQGHLSFFNLKYYISFTFWNWRGLQIQLCITHLFNEYFGIHAFISLGSPCNKICETVCQTAVSSCTRNDVWKRRRGSSTRWRQIEAYNGEISDRGFLMSSLTLKEKCYVCLLCFALRAGLGFKVGALSYQLVADPSRKGWRMLFVKVWLVALS